MDTMRVPPLTFRALVMAPRMPSGVSRLLPDWAVWFPEGCADWLSAGWDDWFTAGAKGEPAEDEVWDRPRFWLPAWLADLAAWWTRNTIVRELATTTTPLAV